MCSTVPPQNIGVPFRKVRANDENGSKSINFWAILNPSSQEFAHMFQIGLGSIGGISALNAALCWGTGKTEHFVSSVGVSILSFTGSYFAGQAAQHQNMQNKLDQMDEQTNLMREQNLQQEMQLESYKTLFNQFANDLTRFEKYGEENQDELAKTIHEFKGQLASSKKLWDEIFKERSSVRADQAIFLDSLKQTVRDIKDASSALKQYEALKRISEDLKQTQKELDLTNGQIQGANETLQQLKSAHQSILVRYEKATKDLEQVNRELAFTVGTAKQGVMFA